MCPAASSSAYPPERCAVSFAATVPSRALRASDTVVDAEAKKSAETTGASETGYTRTTEAKRAPGYLHFNMKFVETRHVQASRNVRTATTPHRLRPLADHPEAQRTRSLADYSSLTHARTGLRAKGIKKTTRRIRTCRLVAWKRSQDRLKSIGASMHAS